MSSIEFRYWLLARSAAEGHDSRGLDRLDHRARQLDVPQFDVPHRRPLARAVRLGAERRFRARLTDAIDGDVDEFVVEGHPAGDLADGRQGRGVRPGDVGGIRVPGDAPILVGVALVRAVAPVGRRLQCREVHVLAEEVEAGGEVGLEEQCGPLGCRPVVRRPVRQ